jgi:hypothetical protein
MGTATITLNTTRYNLYTSRSGSTVFVSINPVALSTPVAPFEYTLRYQRYTPVAPGQPGDYALIATQTGSGSGGQNIDRDRGSLPVISGQPVRVQVEIRERIIRNGQLTDEYATATRNVPVD